MDYKKTLNIHNTNFSMKANLGVREELFQKKWLEQKIYQKLLIKNKNQPKWILHDGPPYANGSIHIGHAVNKILKDFIIRIKFFQDYYAPFIPGFDTHGLPIEWTLIKQGKNTDPKLTAVEKRNNCQQFATSQIAIQTKQFMRLGLLSDFTSHYITYNKSFEIDQLEIFLKIVKKKLIYRSLKPVYWSWSSQTALAEAEVIYLNRESHSIYVKFFTTEKFKTIPVGTNIVIWTTTPWTLPSNLAIAVHPDYKYALVAHENQNYLLMFDLLEKLTELFGWNNYQVLNEYYGKELEYLKYNNPLINEEHFIVLADYVLATEGTGLVHNAPGFGLDDYLTCQQYGIDIHCPINGLGKFTDQVKIPSLKGVFYEDANEVIIDILRKKDALLKNTKFVHSAAHDWRTNKPLIYLATNQWFINISKIKNEVINACKDIKTSPKWIHKQLQDTVIKRKEWCISRQRIWGVPIPILFDSNENPILDLEQLAYTIRILKEKGTNAWFELDAYHFLMPKYQHLKNVTKSKDIMDVWFDSGTSYSILKHHNLSLPAQLYLEGSDQFRGWFNSSLITSVIVNGCSPYQNLISHGFILDQNGMKMSKSKGNVIDPNSIVTTLGSDVLRLWVASSDYTEDLHLGSETFDQIANNYRKIRNSLFRFALANLFDFNFDTDYQKGLDEVHQFLLMELQKTIQIALDEIEKYSFYVAIKKLNQFLNFYSSWYLNLIKDSLYCELPNSINRRQSQTVLYEVLKATLMLLAPFLPHTCEEVYTEFNLPNKQDSIHLDSWARLNILSPWDIDQNKWKSFFNLKDLVYEEIEKVRNQQLLKQNSEAKVVINPKYFNSGFSLDDYRKLLMVAQVEFSDSVQDVLVTATDYAICERCKLYYNNQTLSLQNICKRCDNVIQQLNRQ